MKYIASCSFGKDSIATILLAREHNEPLDEIVYCEVMFDENISGELPEHRDFIYNVAIPKFEEWGYKVTVLRAEKTYCDIFNRVKKKGDFKGSIYGFPPLLRCWANGELKMPPIRKYWKEQQKDVMQYVGIAIDEPTRLDRVVKSTNQISLLQKYGYTEEMAKQKCIEYGLLSPIYSFSNRGGCWFCQNQSLEQLRCLRKQHKELWDLLLEMQRKSPHPFRIETPITEIEERFKWEDAQMTIFDFLDD
jgi:3'-phosphoadenosine 5'-phosphosulfate sulfotransferase (PAPS reductase)/FAD synthetase